jgi:hypothetical protein
MLKLVRKKQDFRLRPIIENQDFTVLDYEVGGKRIKELSTLKEKALLTKRQKNRGYRISDKKYNNTARPFEL